MRLAVPTALPPPRRALTPPFHPYLALSGIPETLRRFAFCCAVCRKAGKPKETIGFLAPRFPPGYYPASCPAEPGLSSARLPEDGRTAAAWFIEKLNHASSKSIFPFSSSLSSSSNSSSSISSGSSNEPASSLSKKISSPSADSS